MSERDIIERPDYIRVVNNNKFKIVGRFNGEDYEFLPGKPLDIPLVVAGHIFDFGKDDKSRALNRLGWMQSSDQKEDAMAKLNKVRFTEAPPLIEADIVEASEPSAGELVPHNDSTALPTPQSASGGGARGRKLPAPQTPAED